MNQPIISQLKTAAQDIKLAHSVFALPFALLAAALARPTAEPWTTSAAKATLVVLCMVAARTWAMLVNRLADRNFDAQNPRTARRAVASGALPVRSAKTLAFASAAAFLICCGGFLLFNNPWPILLAIPVLAWIAFYSFTKRFTLLCHIVLGSALAASPLAAAIAVHPPSLGLPLSLSLNFSTPAAPAIFFLAAMVLPWVAGFDIIYALQDIEFDRSNSLHSIPAALGPSGALWVSRLLHALSLIALALAARTEPRFGLLFTAAALLVAALLVLEHLILIKQGQRGLNIAFFTINGLVSCALGAAGIADTLL